MTLGNYIGVASTFTWPHNPRTFSVTSASNHETKTYGAVDLNIVVSGGGISPRLIPMAGYFEGTDKMTNYRSLSVHFRQTKKLKKLYWETDKFYLGIGKDISQANVGGRTNFIDYTCNFQCVLGPLWGETQRTSGTNAGNAPTYIEDIRGTVTDGGSDVVISDAHGSSITIDDAAIATGQTFLYRFVHFVSSGSEVVVLHYNWVGLSQDSGTTSSTVSGKLVDSSKDFSSTVAVNDVVLNTTDNTITYVTKVGDGVSDYTFLYVEDDIMASGENYVIYRQTGAVTMGANGPKRLTLIAGENVSNITATNVTSRTTRFRDAWYE
jgi:hypothetical protein